jgi:hypothetical protein
MHIFFFSKKDDDTTKNKVKEINYTQDFIYVYSKNELKKLYI